MSLLVRYTLSSPDHRSEQTAAMEALVAGLKSERVAGLQYSCFATDEPTKFIGVLEYQNDAAKQGFLNSDAFAAYRDRVKPIFGNPPETTEITAVASTRE